MRKHLGGMAVLEAAVAAASFATFCNAAGRAGLPALAPVLTFAVLVAAAENAAVLLPSGVRLSPACMVVMAAIVGFDGNGAVLGAALVGWCAGLVLRHLRARSFRLVLFNCSQYALSGAAAAVTHELLRQLPFGALPAVVGASAAFAGVNVGIILLAVTLQGRVSAGAAWRDMGPHLPSYIAFGILGTAVGLLYRGLGDASVLALMALLLIARRAYSSVVGHRRAEGLLELVARCTRAADLAMDEHEALLLLDDIREGLNGEICELLLADERTGGLLAVRVRPGAQAATTARVTPGEYATELSVIASGAALVLDGDAVDESLRLRGIRNAVVAPLTGAEAPGGTLLLANRRAVNGGFGDADVDQLTTIAASIGSTLEKRRLFQRLRWESSHDPLTGHLNRAELVRRLDERLAGGAEGVVLHLDIDGFKDVNESVGHEQGDAVLRELGRRLADAASPSALIARVGDDEFVVVESAAFSKDHAGQLVEALHVPVSASGVPVSVTTCGGMSAFPADGTDAQALLQRAEVAMYVAKEHRSGVERYEPRYGRPALQRLALSSDLRQALDRDELLVHYQPKVDLGTRVVVGCEALVRWSHPDGGLVPPGDFIGLAEQVGLIRPLTMYVLRRAVEDCANWRAAGHQIDVAVNLSVPLLMDENLPAAVADVLEAGGLEPRCLTLEITESSIMRDASRSIAVLEQLAAVGVRLSIDDFGTGYSSLAYLRDLPVHEVKIDRSFVSSLVAENDAIVRLTLELAHSLGLSVVAEGVEDAGASARLTALSCDQAQGYFFAGPMAPADLNHWLQSSRAVVGDLTAVAG